MDNISSYSRKQIIISNLIIIVLLITHCYLLLFYVGDYIYGYILSISGVFKFMLLE